MNICTKGLSVALVSAVSTFAAHAAVVTYTSQSSFDAAAVGLTSYGVPMPPVFGGTFIGSPLFAGPFTLSSTDNFYLYNDGGYGAGQTYIGTGGSSALSISLSPAVTAIGFNFGTYYGPETVSIDVNGAFAASIDTAGAPNSSFFGVTSTSAITSVDLSFTDPTLGSPELDLLNGQIGSAATPEPSSLALLGTGILGAAAQIRRRFSR